MKIISALLILALSALALLAYDHPKTEEYVNVIKPHLPFALQSMLEPTSELPIVQSVFLTANAEVKPFRWKAVPHSTGKSIRRQMLAGRTRFMILIGWETGAVFLHLDHKNSTGNHRVRRCVVDGVDSPDCRSMRHVQVNRLKAVRVQLHTRNEVVDYTFLIVRQKFHELKGNPRSLMAKQSRYQTIRYARVKYPGKLGTHYLMSLNNVIQFSTRDLISHEYMVRYPLMHARNLKRILIIGGGDGHAASELKKWMHLLPRDAHIVNIDLDDVLVDTTQNHPLLRRVSNDSFNHPKIEVIAGDGVGYLLNSEEKWDVIIDDCEFDVTGQDPAIKKLYEDYEQALVDKLAPGGVGTIMEALDDFHTPPDGADDWPTAKKKKWMKKVSDDVNESGDIRKKTPHVMTQLVWAYEVGPEEYIFWSNEPFVRRRDIPDPVW